MDDPTLKVVNCPFCRSVLYTLACDESSEPPTWRLTKDAPTIRSDRGGAFIRCARCQRRVALVMGDELESPGFELAPRQHCAEA
jgi:hypothetical protein